MKLRFRFTNRIAPKPNLPKRSFMTNGFTHPLDVNDYVNVCWSCYFCFVFSQFIFFCVDVYTCLASSFFIKSIPLAKRLLLCVLLCFFGLWKTIESMGWLGWGFVINIKQVKLDTMLTFLRHQTQTGRFNFTNCKTNTKKLNLPTTNHLSLTASVRWRQWSRQYLW